MTSFLILRFLQMKQKNRPIFLTKFKNCPLRFITSLLLLKKLSLKPFCTMLSTTRLMAPILRKMPSLKWKQFFQLLNKKRRKSLLRLKKKGLQSCILLLRKYKKRLMRPIIKPNRSILRSNTTRRKNSKSLLRTNLRKLKKAQMCQSSNRQITRRPNMRPLSQSTRSTSNFISSPMRLLLNIKKKHHLRQKMSQKKNCYCTQYSTTSISKVLIVALFVLMYRRPVSKQHRLNKSSKKQLHINRWK